MEALNSVCGGCHRRAEFSRRGKLGPKRATSKLKFMRTMNDRAESRAAEERHSLDKAWEEALLRDGLDLSAG